MALSNSRAKFFMVLVVAAIGGGIAGFLHPKAEVDRDLVAELKKSATDPSSLPYALAKITEDVNVKRVPAAESVARQTVLDSGRASQIEKQLEAKVSNLPEFTKLLSSMGTTELGRKLAVVLIAKRYNDVVPDSVQLVSKYTAEFEQNAGVVMDLVSRYYFSRELDELYAERVNLLLIASNLPDSDKIVQSLAMRELSNFHDVANTQVVLSAQRILLNGDADASEVLNATVAAMAGKEINNDVRRQLAEAFAERYPESLNTLKEKLYSQGVNVDFLSY
jgi:hypothetical protein